MNGTLLTIESERGAAGDVVTVRGELDLTNVPDFEGALAQASSETVVLDLSELGFVDSAGMRAIDRQQSRLAEQGRSLVVVAPADSRAGWAFRVAGFSDGYLSDSLEDALLRAAHDAAR